MAVLVADKSYPVGLVVGNSRSYEFNLSRMADCSNEVQKQYGSMIFNGCKLLSFVSVGVAAYIFMCQL